MIWSVANRHGLDHDRRVKLWKTRLDVTSNQSYARNQCLPLALPEVHEKRCRPPSEFAQGRLSEVCMGKLCPEQTTFTDPKLHLVTSFPAYGFRYLSITLGTRKNVPSESGAFARASSWGSDLRSPSGTSSRLA
jgi:hypothetical protein